MLKSLMNKTFKVSKTFSIFALLISVSVSISSCTKKIQYPIKLEVVAKEGFKEVVEGKFHSKNKIFKGKEIDRETHTTILFELTSEVLTAKPDGKIVSIQKTIKKDGLFNLNRLGLPEVGEEIKVEIDKHGFILDVTGFPPDSIFYIPSLVFPIKALSKGDSWKESFKWRDYSIPFPLQTDVQFKLVGDEDYKRNRVLRIEILASTKFVTESKEVLYESSANGFVLWDPKEYLVRFAESHFSDLLQIPGKDFRSESESDFVLKLKSTS